MPNEQRLVAISTPLKDSDLILRQATFSETLGQPFVIEADLISADESLPFNKILGQNVTIRYETDQESRYFNGLVTGFKQNENLQRNGYYTATIRPWLWLLTLSQSCRIFQQKSYPDIIKAVFDEMGFADYQDKLRGQYPAQEYVVQFNETDFNFVARILQQEGIYYYFEHTNGKHTLILTDDSVTLNDVGEVSYFELDDSQRNIGVEGISQWRNHRHLRTGGISLSSYDFAKPNKNLDAATKDPQLDAVAPYQKYTYNGKYIERDVGEHYSKVSMERENADYEKKVLAGNYRQLSAGSRFKLTGHGRDDQNSQYLLTDYHCTLLGDDMLREQEKEDLQMLSFSAEAISAKLNFRPPQQQHKPQMRGPQTGTVVGKTGEEIWTDKYGRIKV
ncbi:MAG: type VI secretion system tip protein VgrG, partial [Oleibacter sp.]|nr:type VI secretion system tip protein VgrG [Thalassolituus sp.]